MEITVKTIVDGQHEVSNSLINVTIKVDSGYLEGK